MAGENIIAFDLDRLFRAEPPRRHMHMTYSRAEAARILLTAGGRRSVIGDDREYARWPGAQAAPVCRRPRPRGACDQAIASARLNIRRARRATVILAFMAGAAAMLGAAAAWFAAGVGGQHRECRGGPARCG